MQNGWVSLALGTGSNASTLGSVLGLDASAWYSVGPLVAGIRTSTASTLFGEGVDDVAGLLGLRTAGPRAFLHGAVGLASVHSYRTCDGPCSAQRSDPTVGALAYSLQALANYHILGVGAEIFGAAGPGRASFRGMALSLQLGWFGR